MNYIRVFVLILFVLTVALIPAISAQVNDEEEFYKKLKAEELEKQGKLQQAENQYQSVMNKLNSIEELEKRVKNFSGKSARRVMCPEKHVRQERKKLRLTKN